MLHIGKAALRKWACKTHLVVQGKKIAGINYFQPHMERSQPIQLCVQPSHKPSSHGTGVRHSVQKWCRGDGGGKLIETSYTNKAAETTYKLFK